MRILKYLKGWEEKIIVLIMAEVIVVGFLQVFFRYVVRSSLSWSEELLRFSFEWVVFLAASVGVREKVHVSVSVFVEFLPKPLQWIIAVIVSLVCAGFCVAMAYFGMEFVNMQVLTNQRSPAIDIPMWIPYLGVAVGCGMMGYRFLEEMVHVFRAGKNVSKGVGQ